MTHIYNFSEAKGWAKILPIVGLVAGIGLAVYQEKDCVGCFLGYGLSGMLLGSVPLTIQAHKAAEPISLEDCGCGGKSH